MSLLRFRDNESGSTKSKRSFKVILGIGALVGVIALGSTLAASINLNSGAPVEFGQGVAQTTACDNNILVTPFGRFINATGEGSFMFAGITLSNLDTTSEGCAGKSFSIEAFGQSGSSLATYSISIGSDGSFASGDGELTNQGSQGSTSGVTLTFTTATLDAADVYTITIQSSGIGAVGVSMRLATGYEHTCFTMVDTTVRCWGLGTSGELGNGTTENSSVPVVVTGLSGVTQLSSGREFTCALLVSGSVKCWGIDWADDSEETFSAVPVLISGVSNATAVITGGHHACALISGGSIKCWGANWDGQLGDGTTTNNSAAQPVLGITNAIQIAASNNSSCSLIAGGQVKCWGSFENGQLGNEDQQESALTPVSVKYSNGENVVNAIQLSGSKTYAHYCVRYSSGVAECWGSNEDGQLGDGSYISSTSPVQISQISDFSFIAAGWANTCGQRVNRSVYCWGNNENGQIGDGTNTWKSAPGDPLYLSGITQIDPGDLHVCALISDNTVYCWGGNWYGQLGDGTTQDQSFPVLVNWTS
jgi:alpha-tubulin suppressor-like RCC1 family protein